MILRAVLSTLFVLVSLVAGQAATVTPLGQPTLSGVSLASRCASANARFNYLKDGAFEMFGPTGIAIDPRGRIFIADYGGRRVLTWPDALALKSCSPADAVIGAGLLTGPEALAFDARSGALFVADTLSHTVVGFRPGANGAWNRFVTLGQPRVSGDDFAHFQFPRGLAFDPGGRLFVADDYNNRILIFDGPFVTGESAVDSIYAGSNGGFDGPKALAMWGHTLFVADYNKKRVLRFTGPFETPDESYVASGQFGGLGAPVDLAVAPDGSLLVTDQTSRRIAVYADAVFRASASAPNRTLDLGGAIGPEPLGVAADITGRIFVADYRRWRVLITPEFNLKSPVVSTLIANGRSRLTDLQGRHKKATDRVLIGQQLISYEYGTKANPNAWYGDWLQMSKAALPLPEVMGAETSDLMSYPGFAPNQDATNEMIRHGRTGRPVTLVWHPDNPTGRAFGTPITTAEIGLMVKDGTTIGNRWQVQLDRAAAVLKQFSDRGVPVLFRPVHEQNGSFFWWGHDGSTGAQLRARQAAWVAMWRDMVADLTVRKGLKNIVFVFGANQIDAFGGNNVDWAGTAAPLTYYPGGRWADAVSIDIYDEELDMARAERGLQHYAALVGTGKPVGIAEFGQTTLANGTTGAGAANWDARTLTKRIRDSFPRIVFAIAWYTSPNAIYALPDVANTKAMLADPLIDTQ